MENFHSNFIDEAHRNKFLPFSKDLSKNYWLDKELGEFHLSFLSSISLYNLLD